MNEADEPVSPSPSGGCASGRGGGGGEWCQLVSPDPPSLLSASPPLPPRSVARTPCTVCGIQQYICIHAHVSVLPIVLCVCTYV